MKRQRRPEGINEKVIYFIRDGGKKPEAVAKLAAPPNWSVEGMTCEQILIMPPVAL